MTCQMVSVMSDHALICGNDEFGIRLCQDLFHSDAGGQLLQDQAVFRAVEYTQFGDDVVHLMGRSERQRAFFQDLGRASSCCNAPW